MNAAEREHWKENLRAMIAGRLDGIDVDTPFTWDVDGIKQPKRPLRNASEGGGMRDGREMALRCPRTPQRGVPTLSD